MFNLFKKVPPDIEVIGFEHPTRTINFNCSKRLKEGPQEVVVHLKDGQVLRGARITVENYLEDVDMYWGTAEESSEVMLALEKLYPREERTGGAPLSFAEKRKHLRVQRTLQVMSRDLPTFQASTFDLSSTGARLAYDYAVEPGKRIRFRMEFDEQHVEPLELSGTVVWSGRSPIRGYWIGLQFTDVPPSAQASLDRYLARLAAYEGGVSAHYARD